MLDPEVVEVLRGLRKDGRLHARQCDAIDAILADWERRGEALQDEKRLLERLLQNLEHHESRTVAGQWVNAWAAASIPEWEIRQRLEAIAAALEGKP